MLKTVLYNRNINRLIRLKFIFGCYSYVHIAPLK